MGGGGAIAVEGGWDLMEGERRVFMERGRALTAGASVPMEREGNVMMEGEWDLMDREVDLKCEWYRVDGPSGGSQPGRLMARGWDPMKRVGLSERRVGFGGRRVE